MVAARARPPTSPPQHGQEKLLQALWGHCSEGAAQKSPQGEGEIGVVRKLDISGEGWQKGTKAGRVQGCGEPPPLPSLIQCFGASDLGVIE